MSNFFSAWLNELLCLMNILLFPKLLRCFVSYLYRTGNLDRKQTLLRLCWIIWYLTCHLYKNPTFFLFKNYHKESYISIDEVRGWLWERNKMKYVWHLSDGVYASISVSWHGEICVLLAMKWNSVSSQASKSRYCRNICSEFRENNPETLFLPFMHVLKKRQSIVVKSQGFGVIHRFISRLFATKS